MMRSIRAHRKLAGRVPTTPLKHDTVTFLHVLYSWGSLYGVRTPWLTGRVSAPSWIQAVGDVVPIVMFCFGFSMVSCPLSDVTPSYIEIYRLDG